VRVLSGPFRGARFELDLRVEKAYWLGHYESDLQRLLVEVIRPGAVVYDVGAHIGFFGIGAGRLGARVYAFEPRPENAARIRRNAQLNRLDLEVVDAAAWSSDGSVAFDRGESPSEGHVIPGNGTRAVTLDTFAAAHRAPDVLKIDVEGAEEAVLRGAERILRIGALVICELHGPAARDAVLPLLSRYNLSEVGNEWRILASPRAHGD
jgi:FkbM family methyltransferase